MSDGSVLSQHEIDSLLQGGASEPDADALLQTGSSLVLPKTVKRYDFRRPDKFSKEQLRSLQAMHETYARLASTLLSNQMRTSVDVRVSSIEQGLYEEYVSQVAAPAFVNIVRMTPLEGSILIEFGQDLGFVLIDRLLGGTGALLERAHEVSDVDLQLLQSVGGMLAQAISEAWENLTEVVPTIAEIHQDIQLAALAPSSEVVIMVFLEVTVLDVVAGLSVCTPFSVLEPVLPRLAAQVWAESSHVSAASSREGLREQLARTPTTIGAELGSADVRAAEIAGLQIGDVIRLEQRTTRSIAVSVDHVRKWYGRPGVVDGHIAVELERWAPEELPAIEEQDSDEAPIGDGIGGGDASGPVSQIPVKATNESVDDAVKRMFPGSEVPDAA